ncbi:MAG: hypothetical protein MRK02_08515 [Candidatus Scalindua sp.]|nr:hypothetical protein [Candidatus Scalindua sp.]
MDHNQIQMQTNGIGNDTLDNGLIQVEADIRKLIEEYVAATPYELNQDKKQVDKVIRGLAKRKLKYGYQYCPCRMISEDREIDDKIICPCEFHIEEIQRDGACCCDLFVSTNHRSAFAT